MTNSHVRKPHAQLGRQVPETLIQEIIALISDLGPINRRNLSYLYYMYYGRVLPLFSLDFDDGIFGLMTQLHRSREIEVAINDEGEYKLNLTDNSSDNINKIDLIEHKDIAYSRYNHLEKPLKELFDPNNVLLWDKWLYYLEEPSYRIIQSPYEKHFLNNDNFEYSQHYLKGIRSLMRNHREGIPMHEMILHISIDKWAFKVTSMEEFVRFYPELFYIQRPKKGSFENPIVFCGKTNTYNFQEELDKIYHSGKTPERVVYDSIKCGFLQMVLLMLYEKKTEGLRLSMLRENAKLNFYPNYERSNKIYDKPQNGWADEPKQSDHEFKPIEHPFELLDKLEEKVGLIGICISWKYVGILDLRSSPSCLNDLRLHFYDHDKFDCISILMGCYSKLRDQRRASRLIKQNQNEIIKETDPFCVTNTQEVLGSQGDY